MDKTRYSKYRKKIAGLLLAIFMLPIAYQTVYIAVSHYQNFICTAKNEDHYHIKHKSNSKYIFNYSPTITVRNYTKLIYDDISFTLIFDVLHDYKSLSFESLSPRAPPCLS